jgi:glucose-1-phosphate thymidylyltransferase
MVGIILAGGTGSRLSPITKVVSKQLLPIFDKPMIYYPLSLMMASGIRRIVIIVTPRDLVAYKTLLGSGSAWGVEILYVTQESPGGLPEAFILAEEIISGNSCTLMLGDNVLYGSGLGARLLANQACYGAHIYGYLVNDTSSFGVLKLGDDGKIVDLIEKPKEYGRGYAVPGIYHFDETVSSRARTLKPSQRGELEMVDLLKTYLLEESISFSKLDRGVAWLDTGTMNDLFMAAELVKVVQSRQGMLIGSPDEVAYRKGWITKSQLIINASSHKGSFYEQSLLDLSVDEY